jgi:tellurite resistance protein TehA-like permease
VRIADQGARIIGLSKLAKRLFPIRDSIPHLVPDPKGGLAGEILYTVSILLGLVLWGFALVWFGVAVMMIAMAGRFPFNMGWWGFIFPVGVYTPIQSASVSTADTTVCEGVFTLLTISLGEELESKFFKVLSCVSSHGTPIDRHHLV